MIRLRRWLLTPLMLVTGLGVACGRALTDPPDSLPHDTSPTADSHDAARDRAESTTGTGPGLRVSVVLSLWELQGEMLDRSLPLVSGVMTNVRISDQGEREVSFDVILDEIIWSPTDDPVMPSETLSMTNPGRGAVEFFSTVTLPSRVLLVADGSYPLGLAVVGDNGSLVTSASPVQPMTLMWSISELIANPERFFADPRLCPVEPLAVDVPATPVEALVAFFEFYGNTKANDVANIQSQAWALADRLEGAVSPPEATDEVSGRPLTADINSMFLQLMAGVPVEDVVAPASMSMAVDFTGLADERRSEFMVIFEVNTGRPLGGIGMGRIGQLSETGEDGEVVVTVFETLKPDLGEDVGILFMLEDEGPPEAGCRISDGPALVVPYLDAAGPLTRVVIIPAGPSFDVVDSSFFAELG